MCSGSVQTPNWTVGGDLTVGDTATGALTIDAGATVSNDLATIGNLNGAIGTLTVSGRDGAGAASTWTSTGLVSVGVESGSKARSRCRPAARRTQRCGHHRPDSGSALAPTVSGVGSVWELSTINSFQIGTAGSTLRIDDGGALHSGQGIIGWQPGGNGRVTVTGARSVWDPLNNIYVGFEGTGELQVRTAPPSTHRAGRLPPRRSISGSSRAAWARSTCPTANASTLKASDRIEIGSAGTGTLTIDKGGIAGAAADTWIAVAGSSTGTLHLLGDAGGRGALETGSVVKGWHHVLRLEWRHPARHSRRTTS